MPPIKIQHVVSCSSEDSVHKAENMLVSDHYRKWKSASAGEKQLALILRFEQSSQIHSVDIGNEGSAFVEVLVGRSSSSNVDYQVLIVSSSFMSPNESRQGTNTNRVRIFGPDKLSQTVTKEKWDLVKIVCTQPFNKSIQFGLSFIAFHSPPEKNETTNGTANNKQAMLGAFKLKDTDESESKISVGSFFAKRKNESQDTDTPPSVSQTSTSDVHKIRYGDPPEIKPKKIMKVVKDDNSNNTANKETREESRKSLPSTSTSKTSTNETKSSSQNNKSVHIKKETPKQDKPDSHNKGKDNNNNTSLASSSKASKTPSKSAKPSRPFHKLLDGVVLVLSGYQNPQRGSIRDKAVEMGASYKPDWDSSSTHLICAFTNTPKYQQVQKKRGRIVTEKWIIDCHKQKRLLPWRQFALGKNQAPESSESEDSDDSYRKMKSRPKDVSKPKDVHFKKQPTSSKATNDDEINTSKRFSFNDSSSSVNNSTLACSEPESSDSDEVYRADTDVDADSGNDTESEIAKVVAKESSKSVERSVKVDTSNMQLPDLLDIFRGEHFFLYGEFSNEERKSLVRYIIGCGGVVEEFMTKKVRIVLTNSSWKKDFTDAISGNKALRILSPFWVLKCVESGCVVPKPDFFVSKT